MRNSLSISPWLIAVIVIIVVGFLAFAINRAVIAHRRQASTGREELLGMTAEVRTTLNPEGTAFLEGELWAAISDAGQINPGEEVIVNKVDGLRLWVTKKQQRRA